MSDLVHMIHEVADLFERLQIPYGIMDGWAVRLYGLPRPTYDIDFTVAVERSRLHEVYDAVTRRGFTVPDQLRAGWVHCVAEMPLVKGSLFVEGHGLDIDVFLAESPYLEELMRRRPLHELRGRQIAFVSPGNFMSLKLIAGPPDLVDIEDVLLAKPEIDEVPAIRP